MEQKYLEMLRQRTGAGGDLSELIGNRKWDEVEAPGWPELTGRPEQSEQSIAEAVSRAYDAMRGEGPRLMPRGISAGTRPTTGLAGGVEAVDGALERLARVLELLDHRLLPLMGPRPDAPEPTVAPLGESRVAEWLGVVVGRIERATESVSGMLRSLEV